MITDNLFQKACSALSRWLQTPSVPWHGLEANIYSYRVCLKNPFHSRRIPDRSNSYWRKSKPNPTSYHRFASSMWRLITKAFAYRLKWSLSRNKVLRKRWKKFGLTLTSTNTWGGDSPSLARLNKLRNMKWQGIRVYITFLNILARRRHF
jgi:hypothetical protein